MISRNIQCFYIRKKYMFYTWLITGLCLAILQILSTCEMLKLDTPMDFVSPKSTSSSKALKKFQKKINSHPSQLPNTHPN